ncbi:hypothetical protein KEM54_003014 [Ascosphaera aggregata]|nr:hypothetical protein KEM54_003014 [Ascosphaera aggregata]
MSLSSPMRSQDQRPDTRIIISYVADYAIIVKHISRKGTAGRYTVGERMWQFNCGILGLLLAQSSAFIITNALKNACGKPRPDVIDRCQPKPGSQDLPTYGLTNYTICTQTNKSILNDGFRSFPSGHSSSSFAGLFFLTLYLSGKLHLMDNRGEVWKTMIAAAPVVGAALIAISRIMDARHHPFDVITGSMLGVVCAWVAYRQYFPPLSDYAAKGRAYPIRSWGSEPLASKSRPVRVDSDEVKLVGGYSDTSAISREEELGLAEQRMPLQTPVSGPTRMASSASRAQRHPADRQGASVVRQESMSQYSQAENGTLNSGGVGNEFEMQPPSELGGVNRNNTVSTVSGVAGGRELVGTTYSPYKTVTEAEEIARSVSRDIPTDVRSRY